MTDVFISYAREDKAWAERLAKAIERRGFDPWWDRKIAPGRTFDEVIQEALSEARSVVVLWSRSSVQSDFVKDEAQRAAERGVLIPVLIHDVAIPLGFGRLQTADLASWKEEEFHPQFERVVESIAVHSGRQLAVHERTGYRVLPPLPELLSQLPQPPVETAPRPQYPPSPPEPVAAAAVPARRPIGLWAAICFFAVLSGALTYRAVDRQLSQQPTGPKPVGDISQLVPKALPPPAEDALGSAVEELAGDVPESEAAPDADASTAVEPDGPTAPEVPAGPTPEELEREAVDRYRQLDALQLDPALADAEVLSAFRELRSEVGEHLPADETAAVDATIASLETAIAELEKIRELDGSDRSTLVEKLESWRGFSPVRELGPAASYARQRIAELEASLESYATIASPEDFVTCTAVRKDPLRPAGVDSRFRPGQVNVFARIRAPRTSERLTLKWFESDGSEVRARPLRISRNPAGYRIFDSYSFREPGPKEIRLYNERGEVIGYQSIEVLPVSASSGAAVSDSTLPHRLRRRDAAPSAERSGAPG